MKLLLVYFILFFSSFSIAATSCEDPRVCVPTVEDNLSCIDYVKEVTNRGSDQNDMQDIVRACVNNFGSSCTEFIGSILKRSDLNSVIDYAKACEANYSASCVKALYGASHTRSKNTLLDFARACRQNINDRCVKDYIVSEGRIDHWSLRSYARSCQIYNSNLNRQRRRN